MLGVPFFGVECNVPSHFIGPLNSEINYQHEKPGNKGTDYHYLQK